MNLRILVLVLVAVLAFLVLFPNEGETPIDLKRAQGPADPSSPIRSEPERATLSDNRSPQVAGPVATESQLRLTVLQEGTMEPIEGAVVALLHDLESDPGLARWWLSPTTSRPDGIWTTDVKGSLDILIPSGRASTVLARRMGASEQHEAQLEVPIMEPGARMEEILYLVSHSLSFWGKVIEVPGEAAVEGADVLVFEALSDHGWTRPLDALQTTSDSAGIFHIRYETWKQMGIQVSKHGFALAIEFLDEEHSTPSTAALVPMQQAGAIEVHSRDTEGAAAVGLTIRVISELHELASRGGALPIGGAPPVVWTDTTDRDGYAKIKNLPPDCRLSVEVWNESGSAIYTSSLTLSPGESRLIRVSVGSHFGIDGAAFFPDNSAASNRRIWLSHEGIEWQHETGFLAPQVNPFRETRTDELGRFAFSELPNGNWWIGSPDNDISPNARRVSLDSRDIHLELRLEWAQSLKGIVKTPDGTPKEGAEVQLYNESGVWIADTHTDDMGEFSFGRLPRCNVTLFAVSPGFEGYGPSERWEGTVGANEEVVLALSQGGTITGHLIGVEVSKGEAVQLQAIPTTTTQRPGVNINLSGLKQDGRGVAFFIPGLSVGEYSVSCATDKGFVGVVGNVFVEAGVGAEDIVVIMERAGYLRVISDQASNPIRFRVLSNGVTSYDGTLLPKESLKIPVAAGEVTFLAEGKDPIHVDIKSGEEATIDSR